MAATGLQLVVVAVRLTLHMLTNLKVDAVTEGFFCKIVRI